jgi:hypothetical protein
MTVVPAAHAASGDLTWDRLVGGSGDDVLNVVAEAPGGGVYVAGGLRATTQDFVVARFGADGAKAWTRAYAGPEGAENEVVSGAVDGAGNLFVVGANTIGGLDRSWTLIKYSPAGRRLWLRTVVGPKLPQFPVIINRVATLTPVGVVVDRSGNAYVAARCVDNLTALSGVVLTKISAGGVRTWARTYTGPAEVDRPVDVAMDRAGAVYISGVGYRGLSGFDLLVLKFEASGRLAWARYRDGGVGDTLDMQSAIAVTPAGSAYVATTTGPDSEHHPLLVKFTRGGETAWEETGALVAPGGFGQYRDVVVTPWAQALVAGTLEWSPPIAMFVMVGPAPPSMGVGGGITGTGANDAGILAALDAERALSFVAGTTDTGGANQDIFVSEWSGVGDPPWTRTYDGDAHSEDAPRALLSSGDSVYVAGYVSTAGAGRDGVLLKYER